jgi:hypothetical protein
MAMRHRLFVLLLLAVTPCLRAGITTTQADLLIVGGTESGWAAAIQAARQGVRSIALVHDGIWLGGQYTEQGLACVDENKGVGKVGWGPDWHPMKRSFHRFGLFKELMDRIEAFNTATYGSPMPGRPMHGPSTFRPAEAEAIFRELLQPHLDSGQVRLFLQQFPVAALKSGQRLTGLRFQSATDPDALLEVQAPLTVDASDWGDVVQLAGADFEVGPDPRSRYGEPSAQEDVSLNPPNEMNPLTWTLIVEEAATEAVIPEPPHYDARRYYSGTPAFRKEAAKLAWDRKVRVGGIPPWPAQGREAARQSSILTMRRIVEGGSSRDGRSSALICYSNGQDYPLERLPHHVAEALERTEPGAASKNLVLMTRTQRQIVFEDAKAHTLGLLHHLQTGVHERARDTANSLRRYQLSREFGTPDHLPPKPYIREGLRLKALYMMREQDALNTDGGRDKAREAFARSMYADGIFAWQFHYDFHDTGRTYLRGEDNTGPWMHHEKPGRGVHNLSDRSLVPLRSLVPVRLDGLIGAQGNLGFSSIVSSALRLHDQRVHVGQAAGALAALCLQRDLAPRAVPLDAGLLEEVRAGLCNDSYPPMLLWPWRDLPADHPAFVAINRLSARRLLPMTRREVDFQPDATAEPAWRAEVLRLCAPHLDGPAVNADRTRSRGDFARAVWQAIADRAPAPFPRQAKDDADRDGVPDTDDPLPFESGTTSWPTD